MSPRPKNFPSNDHLSTRYASSTAYQAGLKLKAHPGLVYGSWICHACGVKYGKVIEGHRSTIHQGVCDWCGNTAYVTEPRDYRWPPMPEAQ